jgi:hypothetical protein
VTRHRPGPFEERADPNGDVLVAARCPGLRILAGVEQGTEGIDHGLALGGEGAGGVATAVEETELHRVAFRSGLVVRPRNR